MSISSLMYHEAAHIVAGFVLRIPLGSAEITDQGGVVRMSWWYRVTRMFHPVTRQTVKRDRSWRLAGDYGEQLFSGKHVPDEAHDRLFLHALTRRFRLDPREIEREAWGIVFRERHAIWAIAEQLRAKRRVSAYAMRLLYMNWLARGGASATSPDVI